MTGFAETGVLRLSRAMALLGVFALAACDESGQFALGGGGDDGQAAGQLLPANAPGQTPTPGQDVERPDIFEVTDRGLWDGRPSLGGVWVAHPDAVDPDRVVIRNTENGRSIVGALFRRERENPGPLLQVSSDAAEALGLLAGAPTELNVVVLRREEVAVPEEEVNPVVASLEAPVTVEAETLEPAETEASAEADDSNGAGAVAVVLPPAVEAATAAVEAAAETTEAAAEATAAAATAATEPAADAAEESVDISAVLAPAPAPLPPNTTAQIGIFSVEANAGSAAQTIIAAGIQAAVLPEEVGGRTVWRVVAGPLSDASQITQLKELGFVDAFIIPDDEAEDDAEE
ncbi:MAG: SPOR domain-containing protein [Pseudomonadota bacterium]